MFVPDSHYPIVGHDATITREDGFAVVTEAGAVIHVCDELWRQFANGDVEPAEPERGGAEIVDNVLSFGTPGRGLGRVSYRWVTFVPASGIHVLQRVATRQVTFVPASDIHTLQRAATRL